MTQAFKLSNESLLGHAQNISALTGEHLSDSITALHRQNARLLSKWVLAFRRHLQCGSLGSFYQKEPYVEKLASPLECRAQGIDRKRGLSNLVYTGPLGFASTFFAHYSRVNVIGSTV